MQRQHLQKLSREELVREAERAGVPRPRVLTQAELIDEILKRTATSDRDRARARGWLGRARDLLATVVEKGLHLPDAAAAIRSGPKGWPPPPPPLPTVTLAEIYAAQGHLERAVAVLDEVLRREPDHEEARELRDRFVAQLARAERGAAEAKPEATEEPARSEEKGEAPPEEAPHAAPAGEEREESPRPRAAPASVPPTMPAAETRDLEEPTEVEEPAQAGAPAGEEATSDEEAAAEAERIAGPTSVATTSRSPSGWPPARTAGVEILAPVNVAPIEAEAPPAEPIAPRDAAPEEEALADTAPAEPTGAEAAPEEPAALAEEPAEAEAAAPEIPALPARYDVDEVVAIAVDPSTFYVYWEVRATTFAHMAAEAPGGWLALRVTAVTPGWEGPIVETRDIRIDALFGDRFVHHVRPRADVRVSVGWLTEGRFDPIAVGTEVSAPRAFVAAGAPAPAGAPLDLSEGPHGPAPAGGFGAPPSAGALAEHTRATAMIAAGWVPRDLHGVPMEGAPEPGAEPAPAGWIWVPGARAPALPVTFGPSTTALVGPEGAHGHTVSEGTWWRAAFEGGEWGGASEGGRWGGASEGGRWGGASEGGRWGGASEGGRWSGTATAR